MEEASRKDNASYEHLDVEELLEKNHQQAKNYITSKLRKHQIMKIYRAAENKSKVRDYVCHKTTETVTKKKTI